MFAEHGYRGLRASTIDLFARAMTLPIGSPEQLPSAALELLPGGILPLPRNWERIDANWPDFPGSIYIDHDSGRSRVMLDGGVPRIGVELALLSQKRYLALAVHAVNDMRLCLIHGALLELPGGQDGVILFGDSGLGKSTSAKRYEAQGGCAPADDMILLSRADDGEFHAQPLPTWSTWRYLPDGVPVEAAKSLRIRHVIQLNRGAGDCILPVNPMVWKSSLIRALSLHTLGGNGFQLPPGIRAAMVTRLLNHADWLHRRFGSHELHADLEGDLHSRINEFAARPRCGDRLADTGLDHGAIG